MTFAFVLKTEKDINSYNEVHTYTVVMLVSSLYMNPFIGTKTLRSIRLYGIMYHTCISPNQHRKNSLNHPNDRSYNAFYRRKSG